MLSLQGWSVSKSSPGARLKQAMGPYQPLAGGRWEEWFSKGSRSMPAGETSRFSGSPPGTTSRDADKATAPCPAARVPSQGICRGAAGLSGDIPRATSTGTTGKGGEETSRGCRENASTEILVGFFFYHVPF